MKRLLLSLLLAVSWLALPSLASAQSIKNTITVEPSNLNIRLKQGDEQASIISVTNQYDVPVTLHAELQAIDNNSGKIVPSGPLNSSLAAAINISATDFTVQPQSRYFLTVTTKDTSELQAGGQYAVLVLSDQTSSSETTGLQPEIAIGLFVVKEQGEVKKLELVNRNITRKVFQFPTQFSFELINDGNVHIVPRGYVRVYDNKMMYFETVLNLQSQIMLPNERYMQDVVLSADPKSLWPRKVTFEFGYRADGMDEIKLYRDEFWFVPWFIWPIAIISLSSVSYFMFEFIRKHKH